MTFLLAEPRRTVGQGVQCPPSIELALPVTLSPSLLAESHRLINVARMIAEAPASQLGGQSARSHPSSRMPPGTWCFQSSTLAFVGGVINSAIATGLDEQLLLANKLARDELEAITHSSAKGVELPAQFRYRIVEDYVGVPTAVVARREVSTEPVIRKIRREAGLDSKGRKAIGQ